MNYNHMEELQLAYDRHSIGVDCVETPYLHIKFQNGAINKDEDVNGVLVEDLLVQAAGRLKYYNSQVPDRHNSIALAHIEDALLHLYARQQERTHRGVEGTKKA